jgi:hypothetical protein
MRPALEVAEIDYIIDMLEGIHFAPGDRNFDDNGIAGKQVVHGQEQGGGTNVA